MVVDHYTEMTPCSAYAASCAEAGLALQPNANEIAGRDQCACCVDSEIVRSTSTGMCVDEAAAASDKAVLLAFKASGNGAGLESWAAGSEPCGAGWDSWTLGWRGVKCDAAGGSVERMCAPQPFLACVLHRPSALTHAADGLQVRLLRKLRRIRDVQPHRGHRRAGRALADLPVRPIPRPAPLHFLLDHQPLALLRILR